MPNFKVRTVNSAFIAEAILDVGTASEAQAIGVRGAIAMVVDEVASGAGSGAATVMVGDDEDVLSYVAVSLSISALSLK